MKNNSPTEDNLLTEGKILPVMETFYSLQGEGVHSGKAAFFARIGGCDVGCKWCDSKESWKRGVHPLVPVGNLLEQALTFPSRALVVTGGEPALYNLRPLTEIFRKAGFRTFLETSGSELITGVWDWVCLSPKKNAAVIPSNYSLANELKVIIQASGDLTFAEEAAASLEHPCEKSLQPEWSRRDAMMPLIIRYVLDHPEWKISLQIHKYMRIP